MAIQLDDLVARLRLDTSGVSSGLSGLNSSLSSVGSKATSAGKSLSLGVTAPLVGIGVASTNLAASFDKTMRQVSIATGGPSKALGELAMQMGAETAFSAGEAADAMLELAKGGMTAVQIEGGALAATMKLASAGGVGLAEASTYVSNSMAAFGLAAKDADSVTVALAGAANASSASVESLGQGLSQAAASARNAGLSLQETTGVLSLFDSLGLKGSDAGTSLKSMLNSLIPTTDKAKAAMASANLDFVDAEGNFVSVANMAEQLKRGLGGLSEAQRAQALETIFGSDGMRAASALMTGGAKAVRDYTKASRDQKTTTELANAAMEGTSGAIERAKGSIETAMLVIGQVVAPFVERAAGAIETLANRFTNMPGAMQGMIVAGAALAAVIGPLLIGVGFMASGFAAVAGALAAVSLPMIAVVAGLVGLGAALVVAYQRSETFRAIVHSAFAQVATFITTSVVPAALRIRDAFMNLVAVVVPIVNQIVAVVRSQLPQIQATVAAVFGSVQSIITSAMSIVRSIITIATAVIRTVWNTFGDTILKTISRVMSAVQQVIRGAFQVVRGIFQTVAAALRGDWSGVWDGIRTITSGAMNVLTGIVRGGVALIRGAFGVIVDALGALASRAWDVARGAFERGVTAVVGAMRELPSKIKGVFAGAGQLLLGIGGDIVDGLVSGIRNAAGAVADAAMALVDKIPGPIRKVMGISSPSKVMEQIGKFIGAGLVKGLAGSQSKVAENMSKLIDLLRDAKRKGLAKLASETKRELIPLAKSIEAIRDRIEKARELRESISQNVEATGSFQNVQARTDEEGEELPITTQDVLDAKAGAAARADEFAAVLEQLRIAGLSQPQLDELARSGPQMLEVARATLAGGGEAIAALNAYQSRIVAAGQVIAETGAINMYGAGVDVGKGLIRGLESQEEAIAAAMRKIARRMVRQIRKALKIKSPSQVFDELGSLTGIGFAEGIESTTRAISKASARMVDAATITPPTFTLPANLAASARQAARDSVPSLSPNVRVFIGDRELTDLVRVEIGDTLAPLRTVVRQGALT